MKLLTGNDLASGDVIWWTGSGWSRHVEDSADVADKGDAILHAEEGARRVNGPYIIDATASPDGPRPAHIKDRVRALGPTVRPDLTLKPADPAAGDWGDMIFLTRCREGAKCSAFASGFAASAATEPLFAGWESAGSREISSAPPRFPANHFFSFAPSRLRENQNV